MWEVTWFLLRRWRWSQDFRYPHRRSLGLNIRELPCWSLSSFCHNYLFSLQDFKNFCMNCYCLSPSFWLLRPIPPNSQEIGLSCTIPQFSFVPSGWCFLEVSSRSRRTRNYSRQSSVCSFVHRPPAASNEDVCSKVVSPEKLHWWCFYASWVVFTAKYWQDSVLSFISKSSIR